MSLQKYLLIIVSLITINYYHLQSLNSKVKPVRVKTKKHKHPIADYSNSIATVDVSMLHMENAQIRKD